MTTPMLLQPMLIMTNFHLNTTVVAIFPNACLWRHSLYSNLVLTLKTNCIKPSSYASTTYVVIIRPSSLSDSFVKICATCEIFFWQKVYRPPPAKNFPYAYDPEDIRKTNCAIQWMVIYLVDSAIHLSNN